MVKEKLAQVRFDPVITLSGIGTLALLVGGIGGYYVLHHRVGQLETVKERFDKDHDAVLRMEGDIKVIRALLEKRATLEDKKL